MGEMSPEDADRWHALMAPTRGPRLHPGQLGQRPMERRPVVLCEPVRRASPYAGVRGGVRMGNYAAVHGRAARWFSCAACGEQFVSDKLAAQHVAETGHRVIRYEAQEVVPVDTDDDPDDWEDGEGQSWRDRQDQGAR